MNLLIKDQKLTPIIFSLILQQCLSIKIYTKIKIEITGLLSSFTSGQAPVVLPTYRKTKS